MPKEQIAETLAKTAVDRQPNKLIATETATVPVKDAQIYALMTKVMAEIGSISKDRKNTTQGYSFRGIDDVYKALQPALIKYSVFYTSRIIGEVQQEERQSKSGGTIIYTRLIMSFSFFAPDGSSVETITAGEAMDSADKSTNKAMSAALKYAMFQTFCIPTEDPEMDTEASHHEVAPRLQSDLATEAQLTLIYKLSKEKGLSPEQETFLETRGTKLTKDEASKVIVSLTHKEG